jgi:hypothetical protein
MTRAGGTTQGGRILALSAALAVAVVALAGCSASSSPGLAPNTGGPSAGLSTPTGAPHPVTGPVAGVAIALGKPAIVIAPCKGDVVREVGAFAKDASDVTKNVWLVDATTPRRLAVVGIGDTPSGYRSVVSYSKPVAPGELTGKVVVVPASGKPFTVSTVDSFADAVDNQILVNGNYLSFNQFMQQYSLCKK